jgi:hypothetical protein
MTDRELKCLLAAATLIKLDSPMAALTVIEQLIASAKEGEKPMVERAMRSRAVVAMPGDDHYVEISRAQDRDAPVVHFLSDAQIEASDGDYPPVPQGADEDYETLFQLRLYDIIRHAFAHGYLDTLPTEQGDAIRAMVLLEKEPT